MKKLKLYLIGQKYELELEDEFYEYVKEELKQLNNSQTQIKDLLNLFLKERFITYKNDKKMKKLMKKLEL